MKLATLMEYLGEDLRRYCGKSSAGAFARAYLGSPGFRYMFWWRVARYLSGIRWLFPAGFLARRRLGHYTYKYGISIPLGAEIGPGLYIGHFGCITINEHVVMGRNCNINQGVTIGKHNRGPRKGCPRLGDRVYIGAGAKVFGGIVIGNDVAIGANAVVTRDLPEHAVAVGVPARVISYDGARDYIREGSES